MLKIMIVAILFLFGLFLISFIVNSLRGLKIAKYLHMFGLVYQDDFKKTNSKESALINAFRVFRTCPRLNKLTSEEIGSAIEVLLHAPDPGHLVEKIGLKLDSKRMVEAFRNLDFLSELVSISKRSHKNGEHQQ